MPNELAHAQGGGDIVERVDSAGVLAMVLAAARDPTIDAGKVESLANLAMKLQDREREQQFNSDKAAALMSMPSIRRDGRIIIPAKGHEPERVQGRFVKYESLQAVVDPILHMHNLIITHDVEPNPNAGGGVLVRPILTHTNGYVERGGAMPIPLDTSGGKNNTQGAGSSLSYGMRYTTCAMLRIRIHGIDDDGAAADGATTSASALTGPERGLLSAAEEAAKQGAIAYGEWFRERTAQERGWLAFLGHHDRLKSQSMSV